MINARRSVAAALIPLALLAACGSDDDADGEHEPCAFLAFRAFTLQESGAISDDQFLREMGDYFDCKEMVGTDWED